MVDLVKNHSERRSASKDPVSLGLLFIFLGSLVSLYFLVSLEVPEIIMRDVPRAKDSKETYQKIIRI